MILNNNQISNHKYQLNDMPAMEAISHEFLFQTLTAL